LKNAGRIKTNSKFEIKNSICLYIRSRECETRYSGAECFKKSFSFFIEDFIYNVDKYLSLVKEINENIVRFIFAIIL
jgi:hypothetical protein